MRRAAAAVLLASCLGAVRPAASAAQATHLVVVSGLGGDPTFEEAFFEQARTLVDAARERWGLPSERVVWLAEAPGRDPARIDGRSTRDALNEALAGLAARTGADDRVLLVLFGHGSERGGEATLNLPGPDVTATELATWLGAFPSQTVAVVNTASASGGFLPALSGERRIVATATRSPRERERTRFGGFFAEAYAGEGADADRDGRVSLLEAFEYARLEVERAYERENAMRTEHAMLDDDGDGEGSLEPAAGGTDGALASRFFLSAGPAAVAARAADDPELAALLKEKRALEERVAALRATRDAMEPGRYEAELEALLLELARTNRAIREREGGTP